MRKTIKISILLQTHWMTFQGTASQHQPLLTPHPAWKKDQNRKWFGHPGQSSCNTYTKPVWYEWWTWPRRFLPYYNMGMILHGVIATTNAQVLSEATELYPRLFSLLFPSFLFFIAHWLFAVFFFNEKAGNGSRCKNHKCQNPQLWPLNWATSDLNTIFQESLYKANLRNHADDYVLKQNSQHRPGRQVAHKLNMEAFLDSSPTYGDIDLNR